MPVIRGLEKPMVVLSWGWTSTPKVRDKVLGPPVEWASCTLLRWKKPGV